ncbi:RNA polymerase sigma factor [Larkinella soli]|uniref:RNA polymerase sigma factor n=1 Tax=Larkinella soli TaxID=1770527 RepID=UPI000FFCA65E|nr:sigma-70 family RNA polymerase sigma factor [Larkinella soli]
MNGVCEFALVEGLRSGEASAFELLYKQYYPPVARFIRRNHGTEGDAEDVFQESVVVLYQKILRPDFQLRSTLKTFLYGIARNLWLKKLRDDKLITTDEEELITLQDRRDALSEETASDEMREQQVHAWMNRITGHCRHVLKSIYFREEPITDLMSTMGWKNLHTAANQKYKCIQQLKKVSENG